ncbi:hypothetical protein [Halobacillus shinanisalinarum]|nr:hypothetical protein [Halobacillus shinanisalinarum]
MLYNGATPALITGIVLYFAIQRTGDRRKEELIEAKKWVDMILS